MQDLGRKAILLAATNRGVRGFMSRYGMRLGASRFVAGETLDACLDTLAALNAKGLYANTTLLGEDVTTRDETLESSPPTARCSTASPSTSCAQTSR